MEDEIFYDEVFDKIKSDETDKKIEAIKEVKDKFTDVKRMTFLDLNAVLRVLIKVISDKELKVW